MLINETTYYIAEIACIPFLNPPLNRRASSGGRSHPVSPLQPLYPSALYCSLLHPHLPILDPPNFQLWTADYRLLIPSHPAAPADS
jgi:hypothetical protein